MSPWSDKEKTVEVTWKTIALKRVVLAFMSKDSIHYLGPCPRVHFSDIGMSKLFCPLSISSLVSQ